MLEFLVVQQITVVLKGIPKSPLGLPTGIGP